MASTAPAMPPTVCVAACASASLPERPPASDRPVAVENQLRSDDLVVAVCDNAHEELAADLPRLHWAVADPVRVNTDAAFEDAYADLSRRVRHLTAVCDSAAS